MSLVREHTPAEIENLNRNIHYLTSFETTKRGTISLVREYAPAEIESLHRYTFFAHTKKTRETTLYASVKKNSMLLKGNSGTNWAGKVQL